MQEGEKGLKRKERNSKEEEKTLEEKRKNFRRKERFQEKIREKSSFLLFLLFCHFLETDIRGLRT